MKLQLNKDLLEQKIMELESGLIDSTIELIKAPVLIKRVEEELNELEKLIENKEGQDKEILETRIKTLAQLLFQHQYGEKSHKESIENLEIILPKVYELRNL